ncbi:transcription regulator HTH, apses-type DNA-binding domain-containing protein [Cunninghamella echinulata]|nr:transcription regulator HTH, apses-type DNA-binding domain-containing protein [Cunninghamella echinulata]
MEGLYHNNVYPSSAYMLQHTDQPNYYPPISLPYRSNNSNNHNHTLSDNSSNRPYYVNSLNHHNHHSHHSNIMNSPSSTSSSSPTTSSPPLLSNHHHHHHNRPSPILSSSTLPITSLSSSSSSSSSLAGWATAHSPTWSNPMPPAFLRNSIPPPPPPYYSLHHPLPHHHHSPMQRPKLTTTVWEDEGTLCYQVDAKSVCVARRQDNDMINGTKLLNVVGMSRGKRDGILKNEKGRVVVKVGAMHLKGVWITFDRAKDLAAKFKITDLLYPLFTEDPQIFLCPSNINVFIFYPYYYYYYYY